MWPEQWEGDHTLGLLVLQDVSLCQGPDQRLFGSLLGGLPSARLSPALSCRVRKGYAPLYLSPRHGVGRREHAIDTLERDYVGTQEIFPRVTNQPKTSCQTPQSRWRQLFVQQARAQPLMRQRGCPAGKFPSNPPSQDPISHLPSLFYSVPSFPG